MYGVHTLSLHARLGASPACCSRGNEGGMARQELRSRLSHPYVLTDGSLPREISQLGRFSISPSIISASLQKISLFGQFYKAGVAPASKVCSGRVLGASVGQRVRVVRPPCASA